MSGTSAQVVFASDVQSVLDTAISQLEGAPNSCEINTAAVASKCSQKGDPSQLRACFTRDTIGAATGIVPANDSCVEVFECVRESLCKTCKTPDARRTHAQVCANSPAMFCTCTEDRNANDLMRMGALCAAWTLLFFLLRRRTKYDY